MGTPVGGIERDSVAALPMDWHARYRFDPATTWSECRVLDLTLTGAVVELDDDVPDELPVGEPFSLQIDSIADDDVGIVVPAVVRARESSDRGRPVVEIEFSARREERILLHLLVRLHAFA